MAIEKYALLDTDFISKLYLTKKDEDNRWIDRVLELPGYQFICHEQIATELSRHNVKAVEWLQERIGNGKIQRFSDSQLIGLLHSIYGKNAVPMYLFSLNNACNFFDGKFYHKYYGALEQEEEMSEAELAAGIFKCDKLIGCGNNLGEIKNCLLQQVIQACKEIPFYVFCSDDAKARGSLVGEGIPCISAIASFYVLKERLGIEQGEAEIYFDSWMKFHYSMGQTSFRVHKDTKEMQLMKMDGYEIFNRIYNGTVTLLKNGNLKIKGCTF